MNLHIQRFDLGWLSLEDFNRAKFIVIFCFAVHNNLNTPTILSSQNFKKPKFLTLQKFWQPKILTLQNFAPPEFWHTKMLTLQNYDPQNFPPQNCWPPKWPPKKTHQNDPKNKCLAMHLHWWLSGIAWLWQKDIICTDYEHIWNLAANIILRLKQLLYLCESSAILWSTSGI